MSCCQKFMVGLNFATEKEANQFGTAVASKLEERNVRRMSKSSSPPLGDSGIIISSLSQQ